MYQVCYFSLVSFELIEWIEDPSGGQSKKQARVDIQKVKTMNEKKNQSWFMLRVQTEFLF